MSDYTHEVVSSADKALRSRKTGEKWARDAILPLCSLATAMKMTDADRKTATKPLKDELKTKEAPYKEAFSAMKVRDTELRDRLKTEYTSAEGITLEGIGNISFQEKWEFTVPDPNKVDPSYCDAVNISKISEAIANGIRKIKGVTITPSRVLRVTPHKGV